MKDNFIHGQKPQIVVVSSIFPYPSDSGKTVVLSGFLNYFREITEEKNIHWILVGNTLNDDVAKSVFKDIRIHQLKSSGTFRKLWNVVINSFLLQRKSIQESIFWSPTTKDKVNELIASLEPDLVVYDTVRMGQFISASSNKTCLNILYLDDLFSLRYKRMIERLEVGNILGNSVLGNFEKFIPSFLRNVIRTNSVIQKYLLKAEMKLIEKSENRLPMLFDESILLNNEEAEFLSTNIGTKIKVAYPLLSASQALPRRYCGDPVFIFIGALNIPHNEVGLLEFLQQAFPQVCSTIKNVKLLVIGKNPTERLLKEFDKFGPHLSHLGYVEDLDILFSECSGMIIPLVFGSGVKLKTLEAIARGVPIISTSYGIEGTPMKDGKDCFIENNLKKFPDLMERVLDKELNYQISCAAFTLYSNYYSKEAVYRNYDSIFKLDENHKSEVSK